MPFNKLMILAMSLYVFADGPLYASSKGHAKTTEHTATEHAADKSTPLDCSMDDVDNEKCINAYALDTKRLFFDFGMMHNIISDAYIAYGIANYGNHLLVLGKAIALVVTGAGTAGLAPAAMVAATVAYKAAQGVTNVTHVLRCSKYCNAELARTEAIRLSDAAYKKPSIVSEESSQKETSAHKVAKAAGMTKQQYDYDDFIIAYGSLIPWDRGQVPADFRPGMLGSLMTSLQNTAAYAKTTLLKTGQDFKRSVVAGGEQQGIKCLTKCSVGTVVRTLEAMKGTHHSYEYPCKLIEYLPIDPNEKGYRAKSDAPPPKFSTYTSLIRLSQMMALAHTFINAQSPLTSSRLSRFLKDSNNGGHCLTIMDPDHQTKNDKDRLKNRLKLLSNIQSGFLKLSEHTSREDTILHTKLKDKKLTPKILEENHMLIDVQNHEGKTALHIAADQGDAAMVTAIFEQGANVNIKDDHHRLPLHYTAMMRTVAPPKGFFSNPFKKTVLSTEDQYIEIAKRLINEGSDILAKDNEHKTPTDLAKNPKMKKLLEANHNLLTSMQHKLDLKKIKKDLEDGAHITLKDKDGNSLLMLASKWGHLDVVVFLVEVQKMDVNLLNDETGWSPASFAAHEGHKDILQYLSSQGAELSLSDANDLSLYQIVKKRLDGLDHETTLTEDEKKRLKKALPETILFLTHHVPRISRENCEKALTDYTATKLAEIKPKTKLTFEKAHEKEWKDLKTRLDEKVKKFNSDRKNSKAIKEIDTINKKFNEDHRQEIDEAKRKNHEFNETHKEEIEKGKMERQTETIERPATVAMSYGHLTEGHEKFQARQLDEKLYSPEHEEMIKLKHEKEDKYEQEVEELRESQKSEITCVPAIDEFTKGDSKLQTGFEMQDSEGNMSESSEKENSEKQELLEVEIQELDKKKREAFQKASDHFLSCVTKVKNKDCPVTTVKKKKNLRNLYGLL